MKPRLAPRIAAIVARVKRAFGAGAPRTEAQRPAGTGFDVMVLPDPAAGLVDGFGHAQVVLPANDRDAGDP